ncbi:nucleoside hydrolase [Pseudoscardovia suis]|uniref:IunH1 inosine-uridine preferring nucleoside hydrolase n=1 Tax=Pseudoscardovia suis TaxID=987063 RepID=A0A261EYM7_9BIFI|nr:nucleoside hydrolase [Pseudoscardovia suis]OZG51948.1 IunH1 inosine-uridine preferring nucleoside hydrolase [Pseudoscardovia suis]PJJ69454.1 inosine-uridine nucleoside N-ribohydrolase [Pseudoscardovia suis]
MRNRTTDGGVMPAGPILMDTDTGVDDALALALLLGAAPGRLIGVVATYGNVAQSQAERNTRDVLRLLGADAVPVYAGSRAPSWADCFVPDAACAHFHGFNGLGGLDVDDYLPAGAPVAAQRAAHLSAAMKHAAQALPDPALVHSADATARATRTTVISYGGYLPAQDAPTIPATAEPAGDGGGVDAIIAAARRWGGDLTLVTTGPLTDAAEAIRRAPEIARNLRIVAMGGAFLQQGNCYDLTSETNIIQDPEAADFVVRSGADVTLVGLDATHRCLCTPAMRDAVRSAGTAQTDFLADIMSVMIEANASVDPQFALGAPLHDPLAAAVALDPTLVRTIDLPMKVQLATGDGHGVRGRTVGDPMGLARLVAEDDVARVHVAVDADSGRFAENFLAALINVPR